MAWGLTHDFRAAQAHMASLRRQVRFATAGAINDVLFAARADEIAAMHQGFDRPTPFVLNSVRVDKATPESLEGTLYIPTEAGASGANLPAGKPLLAEVYGGARRLKRSERLLQAKGVLPQGYYAVPGPAAELDAYGNMTRRQILHLLAYLQAYGETARSGKRLRSNTTDAGRARLKRGGRKRAGVEYFVVQPGTTGLRPGVYMRQVAARRFVGAAQRVRAVLFFVTGAQYAQRLAFEHIAATTAARRFDERFERRFAYAMATAR